MVDQEELKKIKFKNKRDAKSHFDLVHLQDLLRSKPKDHSPFANHTITFYAIFLVTANIGKHTINYVDHPYKKGTVFTIRKDTIHKFHKGNGIGRLLIFTEDFVVQYLDELHSKKLFQLFNELLTLPKLQLGKKDFIEIENITNLIANEYKKEQDSYSSEIIRSLLHVLITQLFRIKSLQYPIFQNNKHLTQFIKFQEAVEEQCFENKKVSYYADLLNITPRTLGNIAHSIAQKSAKAIIDDILITKIKRRLINSPLSIKEIAYQAGFMEPTNMFKYFKKQTGFSPNTFRKDNQ